MGYGPGTRTFTARGAVGTSDSTGVAFPVVVYDVSLIGGGTATSVLLYNGVESTGTTVMRASVDSSGSVLSGDNFLSTNGVRFKDGCYLHFKTKSTMTTASVTFLQEPG